MSAFRYITDEMQFGADAKLKLEIAYQLKRIADAQEELVNLKKND